MKVSSRRNRSRRTMGETAPPASGNGRKAPYLKPRVEPAGSVFSRTKALGGGTKDGLTGSSLL